MSENDIEFVITILRFVLLRFLVKTPGITPKNQFFSIKFEGNEVEEVLKTDKVMS
jgi:hypothetical protein